MSNGGLYALPGDEEAGEIDPRMGSDFDRQSDELEGLWALDSGAVFRFNKQTDTPKHKIRILSDEAVEFDGEPFPVALFVAEGDMGPVNVLSALLHLLVVEEETVVDTHDLVKSRGLNQVIIGEVLDTATEMLGKAWPFYVFKPGKAKQPFCYLDETIIEDLRSESQTKGSAASVVLNLARLQSEPEAEEEPRKLMVTPHRDVTKALPQKEKPVAHKGDSIDVDGADKDKITPGMIAARSELLEAEKIAKVIRSERSLIGLQTVNLIALRRALQEISGDSALATDQAFLDRYHEASMIHAQRVSGETFSDVTVEVVRNKKF